MSVLLNIGIDAAPSFTDWIECEGFKLQEDADGSFTLIVTTDLVRARDADRRAQELLDRIREPGKAA